MAISVETLWVIYFALLIIIGLIFIFVAGRSNIRLSVGILIAIIVAGVITWLVYMFWFDRNLLTPEQQSNLQSLLIVVIIITFLVLVWVVVDLFSVPKTKPDCHKHVEVVCDPVTDECKVKEVDVHCESDLGRKEMSYECDDIGCSLISSHSQSSNGDLKIQYLA